MLKNRVLPTITLLCGAFSSLSHADISVSIEGIDGPLKDNVDVYLSTIPEEDYSLSLRFKSRVETSIQQALKALGYYEPKIEFIVVTDDEDHEVTINISPGPPVLIRESDIVINGEAKNDPDFITLVEESGLHLGSILNHSKYDALKSGIRNLALRKGYFDGDFTLKRLEVSPENRQVFVRLHYDSGKRYHYGETTIIGSQIDQDRVLSLLPYKPNDPYLASQIGELNQSLSNTEWFSSVLVEGDIENIKDNLLPINVSLAPQARNKIETGLGYSTDVGVRGTVKWNKPWLNSRGHSFDSSLSVSNPEQTLSMGYKIPLEDVLNEYYQVQFGMKNVDNRDTESQEYNLSLERHWKLESGWHRTAFTRVLYEDYRQGTEEDISTLILPGVTYTRSRVRGGAMPMWGDKQVITVEVSDKSWGSDASLLRVQGRTAWVRSSGNNHRGIARFDGGGVYTSELENIPPSLRFFAGGDNNLRGYGYESISPKDEKGSLTGGQYMATSSLEYQYRVVGNWWAATFVDYGSAWTDTPEWKTGTGVGVRWASPIGPIRLDFAWGLDEKPKDRFQIHFTLGPEV